MVQAALALFREELGSYWWALVLLVALTIVSSRMRWAVSAGRLGATIPKRDRPAAIAWAIVCVPVGWWLWSLWISHTQAAFFLQLTDEDGWMEYGQVLLLCLGVLTSGLVARALWRRHRRLWAAGYVCLALALFWVAGEEISWGQRLLHLPTPAWFVSHNTQQEMNLHNLGDVDGGLSSLADEAILWVTLLSFAVRMTGLDRVKRLNAALWLPPPMLVPALWCVISYGRVLRLYGLLHPGTADVSPAVLQLQEPREVILYFSILAFLLVVLDTLPEGSRLSSPATRGVAKKASSA